MTSYFANTPNPLPPYLGGSGNGVVSGPNHHDQYNTNGDIQHHMMGGSCHENGRGLGGPLGGAGGVGPPQLLPYSHQHAHHQPIHYGSHQPYPRFPPYDRLEVKHCPDGSSQPDTSPYYNNCPTAPSSLPPTPQQQQQTQPPPTSQGPPSLATLQQQQQQQPLPPTTQQYECGRGSITPPSLDGSNGPQYGNCKMQSSMVSHSDPMTPIGPSSPSPQHLQQQHPIYGSGPIGSPNQNSNSAIHSPIYPWMRSQFGKSSHLVFSRLPRGH